MTPITWQSAGLQVQNIEGVLAKKSVVVMQPYSPDLATAFPKLKLVMKG